MSKAKMITKWLGEQNIEILGPWPGNFSDLNPIENLWSNLKKWVNKQKPQNCDKKTSTDYARMGCHQSGFGPEADI